MADGPQFAISPAWVPRKPAEKLLGHSMKGSGEGYGFDTISEIGRFLEEAAKKKRQASDREMDAKTINLSGKGADCK